MIPILLRPRCLAVLLFLTCLLNGIPFLIGRIGLLDPMAYKADYQRFCPSSGPPAGLVSACAPLRPSDAPEHQDGFERLDLQRLHTPSGYWTLLKSFRLLLLLGSPLLALLGMWRGYWPWPCWQSMLPALPLLASSAFVLLAALPQAPINTLLFGFRSMTWLPLLVLLGPISQRSVLTQLAKAMALLILLQLPVMLLEAIWGLPMPFGPPVAQLAQASSGFPTRLVGTFILPNSLGIAVVSLLGFCMAYLPQRRAVMPLAIAALPIFILARSGTGLLIWLVLISFWANRSWRAHPEMKLGSLTLIAAISPALPFVLGRPDLWQSIGGRIEDLILIMENSDLLEWIFGHGLSYAKPTDSLPEFLFLQGGLVAVAAFYGLMLWTWCQDKHVRPFLLSIVLGSLTLAVVNLFPLNFLLAISINRSLSIVGFGQKTP